MVSTAKIVSFSLYGALPLYTVGAVRNAELVYRIYPGWKARFYVNHIVPDDVIEALRATNAEIIFIEKNLGPMYGRYWRLLVASDPDVERFIIRDCDSRLNWREKAAVDEWMASGCSFHVMRDSIHHKTRMLGGMWGGVGGIIKNVDSLIDSWGRYSVHGENDQFVSEKIFPLIENDYICHDSWGHFPDARPFPKHAPLEGTSYVGEIIPPNHENIDVWRRVGELGDETVRLRFELDATRLQLRATETERDAAQLSLTGTEAQRDAARLALAAAETELDAARLQLTATEAQRDAARLALAAAGTELDAARLQLKTIRDEREMLQRQTARLTHDLSENQKQLEGLQLSLTESQRTNAEILKTITTALRAAIDKSTLLAARWDKLVLGLEMPDGPRAIKWLLPAARILRGLRGALSDVYRLFLGRMDGLGPKPGDASPADIYLQPHPDDICFSLGALAYKRGCGMLLTVFPVSAYMPNPKAAAYPSEPLQSDRPSSEWITNTRINEDRAFAEACGLTVDSLNIPSASFLGHDPFDLSWVNENQQRIASALLNFLLTANADRSPGMRPWLFCPSGIGGHVDHVAIRNLAVRHYDLLSLYYRIVFYEDLHYASVAPARANGIGLLQEEMPNRQLYRYTFPLAEGVAKKLSLIRIYGSQFLQTPQSIDQFTPAADAPNVPHEAIWSVEKMDAHALFSAR